MPEEKPKADGCLCIRCGTKWPIQDGINYSGFERSFVQYRTEYGLSWGQLLIRCLCQKCAKSLVVPGQQEISFEEEAEPGHHRA